MIVSKSYYSLQVARSVSCIRDKAAGTYRQAQRRTGEPELVEYAKEGKPVCSATMTHNRHRGRIIKWSTRKK